MGSGAPNDARNGPQPLLVPPVTAAVAERGHHYHHQQPLHVQQLSKQPYKQGPCRPVLVCVRFGRSAAGLIARHHHVQFVGGVPPRQFQLAAVAAIGFAHLVRHQHSSGQRQRGCRRRNPGPVRGHHHH